MKEIYRVKTRPVAFRENVIQGEQYRITVLTDGLIRLEYSEDGVFEDRATQMAFYRDFPKTNYRLKSTEDGIEIYTSRIQLIYNEKPFTGNGLSIQVKGNMTEYMSMWHFGEDIHDLGGTARTLDTIDGACPLGPGIISKNGYAMLDDSKSQVLLEDGRIEARKKGIQDLYFFGYGHDYKEALRDFYYLCGKTPMLPRYALGNWWSRYYAYTEESYMALMERFDKEEIPFTVAVIDMDWHLVDIDPKYGSGWTGYTWNKDLFPDPKRFLKRLHNRGMHTTLNVHPADGVRGHEEVYQEMAKALNVDYEKEDTINFDLTNPKYLEAYFKYLHHPKEEEGVDFWWIDWQQGSSSKVEGLDPLWMLNHYHFLDSRRNGKRPMTFSRYAGPGSHRYPIGFSGDSVITWASLDFQPYFTAAASNIGYGWWSHDIGGHMHGYKDDEMEARWTQFGIYSPIMRLHSTASEFHGKEPWRFKKETECAMKAALRERHRMIPYLYTMNHRSYQDDMPMILPMYYEYPEEAAAYNVKNQYYFGTEMMVAPITTPRIPGLNMAKVTVWLPEGVWYDIHTGMMYDGNRTMDMYRSLKSIPVLAKAGSILPFTDEISAVEACGNPQSLRIKVFAGAEGTFNLYEDDNESCDYEEEISAITTMTYIEERDAKFVIHPVRGTKNLLPQKRRYIVEFVGYAEAATKTIYAAADGIDLNILVSYDEDRQAVLVEIPETETDKTIVIKASREMQQKKNAVEKRIFDFLNQAEIDYLLKDKVYAALDMKKNESIVLAEWNSMNMDTDLYGILMEILTARV